METYTIQVQLGDQFADLYVKARSVDEAIRKAKQKVAKDESLKVFRHRFANYVA